VTCSWPRGPMRRQILHPGGPSRTVVTHAPSASISQFLQHRSNILQCHSRADGARGRCGLGWSGGDEQTGAEKVVDSWKCERMNKRNACVQLDYRASSPGGVRARRPCRPRLSPYQQEEAEKSIWQKFCQSKNEGGQTKENKFTMCK
jgi:hypothetical protein